jgi:hypothetical protein
VTEIIKSDMRSDGLFVRDAIDAGYYVEELAPFIDALRLNVIELLAHRNRRTLDRKRIHDA